MGTILLDNQIETQYREYLHDDNIKRHDSG